MHPRVSNRLTRELDDFVSHEGVHGIVSTATVWDDADIAINWFKEGGLNDEKRSFFDEFMLRDKRTIIAIVVVVASFLLVSRLAERPKRSIGCDEPPLREADPVSGPQGNQDDSLTNQRASVPDNETNAGETPHHVSPIQVSPGTSSDPPLGPPVILPEPVTTIPVTNEASMERLSGLPVPDLSSEPATPSISEAPLPGPKFRDLVPEPLASKFSTCEAPLEALSVLPLPNLVQSASRSVVDTTMPIDPVLHNKAVQSYHKGRNEAIEVAVRAMGAKQVFELCGIDPRFGIEQAMRNLQQEKNEEFQLEQMKRKEEFELQQAKRREEREDTQRRQDKEAGERRHREDQHVSDWRDQIDTAVGECYRVAVQSFFLGIAIALNEMVFQKRVSAIRGKVTLPKFIATMLCGCDTDMSVSSSSPEESSLLGFGFLDFSWWDGRIAWCIFLWIGVMLVLCAVQALLGFLQISPKIRFIVTIVSIGLFCAADIIVELPSLMLPHVALYAVSYAGISNFISKEKKPLEAGGVVPQIEFGQKLASYRYNWLYWWCCLVPPVTALVFHYEAVMYVLGNLFQAATRS